ncbi:efflux RND transporter permease subunit [Sandaracinobacter neustonicus]|uniref:Efflux RND transporter permease subunit n=1 Tax=Sandaracinobacter neustonicus TaxID=1715348 RepID=A0A501XE71_9SPHN|nr:efflux RND transporter permease subunit [Sandaracinobacter neustonicus]TPE58806.1 efflux RND transporter permease subunit [Sandaracinobacter neustonicus]
MPLGVAGRLTKATIQSPLTPLLLLASLLIGLLAIMTIPREEEPQISVPMVDLELSVPGMSAADAVEHVGKPLEEILLATPGVEHVYVQARDHGVLVTARFEVGSRPEDAAIRVSERLDANADRAPPGVPWPKVTVRGIDDVPILVLTLSPEPGVADRWSDRELRQLAARLRSEMLKVPDVGLTFLVGGRSEAIRIVPDPARLAAHGVPLSAVIEAVQQSSRSFPAGTVRNRGEADLLVAGGQVRSAADLQWLQLRSVSGAPVLLSDVARVEQGGSDDQARSWRMTRDEQGSFTLAPAVSIAIAKRTGANAVTVSEAAVARLESLKGSLIPDGVRVEVTRNYGETANEKANELIFHLALATVSIVILVGFAVGWREAAVTAIVIPTTILLTMFASKLMGYTINRVSLFALIFSIGILVDDAIVIIENIARHWAMRDGRGRIEAAIDGVAEVGNPTIVATLTVVMALLPMLFVSGLMGPYMAPIPVNASAAMIFSFFVAVIIAPWLMVRFARMTIFGVDHHAADAHGGKLGRAYEAVAKRVIATRGTALAFLLVVGVATLVAGSMFYFRAVTVKLLPFDNKSELQLVLDMPPGTSLEDTQRTLIALAGIAGRQGEVTAMDLNAGTAAPFNFNGLVRHYFLRRDPNQGDVMITLQHRSDRARSSHEVALALRAALKAVPLPPGATLGVVETPPGPPVMATLLAEIYGPDEASRRATAMQVEKLFRSVDFIVDVQNSFRTPAPQLQLLPNRVAIDHLGLSERQLLDSVSAVMGRQVAGYAPRGGGQVPLPIEVSLDQSAKQWNGALQATPAAVAATPTGPRLVELGELVTAQTAEGSHMLFRRNGRAADMVMAELAGTQEAPIYGMIAVRDAIDAFDWAKAGLVKPLIRLNGQPTDESVPSLLWDGEWEITWVTFRDMGGAFLVALLGIYVLVVAQFRNFKVPLVILTPIPLTLVGIVIGHMLFRAPFTATSMIGFIALAGIIVRNSILLVDFINHARAPGKPMRDVLLEAGRIRFKPILLTALAAMIGAATILMDPIFQGLAISLLFGLASSTLLTVLVIPAIYIILRDDGLPPTHQPLPDAA